MRLLRLPEFSRCPPTTYSKLNRPPAKASDDLFAHQKTAGLICDGSPLEGEEADLIAMYRLLPEEQREDIFDLVHLKYRKHVERKKESIYWTYHNGSSATKSGPAEDAEAQGGTA